MAQKSSDNSQVLEDLISALVQAGEIARPYSERVLKSPSQKKFSIRKLESRAKAVIEIIFGRDDFEAKPGKDFFDSDRLLALDMLTYKAENPEISDHDLGELFAPKAEHKIKGAYKTKEEIERLGMKEADKAEKYRISVRTRILRVYGKEREKMEALRKIQEEGYPKLMGSILEDRDSQLLSGLDIGARITQAELMLLAGWLKKYKAELLRILEIL